MKDRTEEMMKKGMKTAGAIVALLVLVMGSGCTTTKDSGQGGIVPLDEGFSITVPASSTLKQGASTTISISLNRGAYFKRDVHLYINTDGINVTPSYVLIKASDRAELKFQITAARDAAIGEYRVSVKGIPETGDKASTVFTVKVTEQ
jgi:uncharacterized membrane protein